MPLLALKAHYDGHTVVFDEPCELPPQTPLLVVVNPQGETLPQPLAGNRAEAFREVFGALRGQLSTIDEFIAQKAEEEELEDKVR